MIISKKQYNELPNELKKYFEEFKNINPCVKPIKLMSYLVTLGSREGDVVLDPFIGSGTTAIACRMLSRKFIGYEIDKEYYDIARARLKKPMEQCKVFEFGIGE